MLAIRFLRIGKKNQPFFRIVVTEKKNPPRGGRFLEVLGFYNPMTKEKKVKEDRVKYWLSVGAQPSDRVYNLLVSEGVVKGKKINLKKKSKKKTEKTENKEEEIKTEEKTSKENKTLEDEKKPLKEGKAEEGKEVKKEKGAQEKETEEENK